MKCGEEKKKKNYKIASCALLYNIIVFLSRRSHFFLNIIEFGFLKINSSSIACFVSPHHSRIPVVLRARNSHNNVNQTSYPRMFRNIETTKNMCAFHHDNYFVTLRLNKSFSYELFDIPTGGKNGV